MLTGIGFLYLIMAVLSIAFAYIWTFTNYVITQISIILDGDIEKDEVEEILKEIPTDITWENTIINTLDTYQLTSHKFSFNNTRYKWEWTCVVSLHYKTIEEPWYIKSYILLENTEVFYMKITCDNDENELLISISKSSNLSNVDIKISMVSCVSLLTFLGKYVEENHESEMRMVNSAFTTFPHEVLDTTRKQKFKYHTGEIPR